MLNIDRTYNPTPPVEPVTLADAKIHLRVDFTDDDAYISSLISACRHRVEDFCFISIVPRTIILTTDIICDQAYYELPYGPITSVTGITTLDNNSVLRTLNPATNDYYIRGGRYKSFSIVNNTWGNIAITYVAGYTSSVPEDLILAIKNEIAFRYENRGDSTNRYASQNVGLSESAEYLATPYKRLSWL